MKLALHVKYVRGGASMYLKKHTKSILLWPALEPWISVDNRLTYDQLSYAEF
jgi:hypothetical protein